MIKPLEPEDEFATPEELNRVMREFMDAHNFTPNPKLGGFTPESLYRLYRLEWNTPNCPLKLGSDLPLSTLSAAPVFTGMRNLLLYAVEKGGLALTVNGYLKRTVVADVVGWFMTETEQRKFFKYAKVMNESDSMPVWRARIVLELSGMLRKNKGRFVVPKNKLPLLKEEKAGKLAALLFTSYFRKYNLGHMTHYPDGVDVIQNDVAYVLYNLGRIARSWTPLVDLPEKVLNPYTLDCLQEALADNIYSKLHNILDFYLLRNFERWGLVECQREPKDHFSDKARIKTSPLYDQWIRFDNSSGSTPPEA